MKVKYGKEESIYREAETNFHMKIKDFELTEEKLSLTLNKKEPLVGLYYLKSQREYLGLKEKLKYGVEVELEGTLKKPNNNTIPNTFNYKEYLNSKGIYYTLTINELKIANSQTNIIDKIKNLIYKRISTHDKTGYIKAFILGDKNNIDEESYHNYQKIGVTHLFALSGMHIGLLSSIILKLLKPLSIKKKYFLVDTILIIYGYICNFPSSIKRCIVFFIINSVNKIFDFKLTSIKVFLYTICFLILTNHKIIYDIGFRYSACTVFGILISSNFIKDQNKFLSSIKLSLVAFLFSLPISLSSFYEVNLLSIIYNLIFIPFISLIVYPLSLLTFIFPVFSSILEILIKVLEQSSAVLSKITVFNIYAKLSLIEIIIFYILLFLLFYKGFKKLFILVPSILVCNIVAPYFDNQAYLYFFDVGQGDSALIISPYRKDIIMIDTGGIVSYNSKNNYMVSDNVITFLKSKGIKKIDLLILSHGDADHAKEVENIHKEIPIKNLKINEGEKSCYESAALKLIKENNYTPRNIELNYLNYKDYKDENGNSLLVLLKIYNTKIISFGDAPKEVEEDIIKKYNLKDIDIAKISHHGSNTSSSYTYLKEINPEIAIISSGRNNRFNHPNKETLNNLEKLKINYLNTQTSGTIEFIIKGNNVTYKEYKP